MTQEVDAACYCKDCESRTKEFYRLRASCGNCNTHFVLKLRNGDRMALRQECPACGVGYRVHTHGLAI